MYFKPSGATIGELIIPMGRKSRIEVYYDRINAGSNIEQHGFLGHLRQGLLFFEENRREVVIKMIPEKTERLLDVGCKYGSLLMHACDKFDYAYGVDISSHTLTIARKEVKYNGLGNKILFRKANVEDSLPFRSGYFDVVTCVAILEHLFDPWKAVEEMYRVLKEKGYIIIQVPNVAWFVYRLKLLFGVRPRTSWAPGWDGGHISYFTFRDLEALLKSLGFKIVRRDCSGILAKWRHVNLPLLASDIVVLAEKE